MVVRREVLCDVILGNSWLCCIFNACDYNSTHLYSVLTICFAFINLILLCFCVSIKMIECYKALFKWEMNCIFQTSLNFNNAEPHLDIQQFFSTIRERETERVWFGSVWFGLVWGNIHLKLLWNFHQDPTCFGCFRKDIQLV